MTIAPLPPEELDAAEARRLALDRQLCFALYSASNLMTRLYGPHLQQLDLTYPQYLVLLALWPQQPRSVGDLGAELGLNFGTLSPLLKRMQAKGLIQRRRDPQDERRVHIALTDAGIALRRPALQMHASLGCDLGLPSEDIDHLRDRVQALTRIMARIESQRASAHATEGETP